MKLVLKYGIAVTLVIAAWVALKHFVLHLESQPAQIADVAIFNIAAIAGLVLGIKSRRAANGGLLTFGEGWKTGMAIAVTYALLTSLYFVFLLAVVGPKLMQQEGETSYVKAFAGVSLGFAVFGAIFSAIIALILKKKLTMNIGGC
jgi:FtsH-binding integral membrane protein